MSDDQLDELIAAYALGATSPAESAEVEHALETDPDAARAFDDYLATVAEMGSAAGDPADLDDLWERIAHQTRPAEVVTLRPRANRVVAAIAVAAVSLSAVLGVALFAQQRSDEPPMAAAVAEARDADGTTVVAMTGDVAAEVVLGADGTGFVVSTDLPALDPASTYQLWAIVGEQVISAGVLGNDPDIAPFHIDAGAPVAGFALTVEVSGGVVSSEQEAVSVGLLDA